MNYLKNYKINLDYLKFLFTLNLFFLEDIYVMEFVKLKLILHIFHNNMQKINYLKVKRKKILSTQDTTRKHRVGVRGAGFDSEDSQSFQ